MDLLEGKTVIVTGGGSGIGRGVAEALAQEGANLVVCGRRSVLLEAVVGGILDQGGKGLAIPADVAAEIDVEHVVSTTLATYGSIDILVNNAGVSGGGPIHTHDVSTWDRIIAINLRGPFLMARAILPYMRAQNSGHLIQISSESGLEYYPGNGAYGVSKHALNALSEYIQRENQAFDIRVDTICPGMVVTEMTEHSEGLDHDKCLYPADIAELVLWLVTRRPNVKIGRPVLIQTMENPWT